MTTENTENQSALEILVGDGKKFKTAEDLAKGKVEADAFIVTLQNQIKELGDELGKANISAERRTALENLMSTLTNTTKNSPETKGVNQPSGPDNQTKTLSHDDVVKLLEERELSKAAERNKAVAKGQLSKIYGEKTDEVIAKKAKELGISVAELEGLAAKSPQLFLNAVGANARDNSTRPMANHGSVNTTGSDPDLGGGEVRNKAYYDNLRSSMGALKFVNDSKLQVQRHRDMAALGDAWDA